MTEMTIHNFQQLFERHLETELNHALTPLNLLKPMVYSLKNGGKRLRPAMVLSVIAIVSPSQLAKGLKTATALEFIHTYSLIHDDLPAMDNDALRRGVPTNHIAFDEATAILSGDALLTDAFRLIAEDEWLEPTQKVELIRLLSAAAGSTGMVAGQIADIEAESKPVSLETLQHIHALKTGELFTFAIEAGAIIAEVAPEVRQQLKQFSQHFGIAYQIHNDVMDVIGTTEETGKIAHADVTHDKSTYPVLLGLNGAKQALKDEISKGLCILSELSETTGQHYEQLGDFIEYLTIKD